MMLLLSAWVAFGLSGVAACGPEEDYLVLTEEQKGIAGTTGTRWRIGKDGKWEVFEFRLVRKQIREIENTRRTGELSSDQLVQLARCLAEEKCDLLPSHLGSPLSVNPHRYILKIGDRNIVMDGVEPRRGQVKENIMEGSPPMSPDEERDRDRFANVASLIESHTMK